MASNTDYPIMSLDIEYLRKRLLDLSARNRLLNYSHRATSIRVVDESPNQLYDLLVRGEELNLIPIPKPTEAQLIEHGFSAINKETGELEEIKKPSAVEWANVLGSKTDYELPELFDNNKERYKDKDIQLLFFPDALETRLRDLYNKARGYIEETGTNILYVIFGFLEWYDNDDGDKARMAPLHLVPIKLIKGKLDKRSNNFLYAISYTADDILPNISLQEKLKNDFGLFLPDLNQETLPEDYFKIVKQVISKSQPRWKIHRFCTLGLLDFGKLLLYLDLNPKKWPGESIIKHNVINRLQGDYNKENALSLRFTDDYPIDKNNNIQLDCPLIYDADSSQHSVLMDALNGNNLVVEGPPGTGKSQTIANLIAVSILKGKKILFVTEKLAALEVVKTRLDAVGLGDFCLELHSHKEKKNVVLQDLYESIESRDKYIEPSDIKNEIKKYEDYKYKLLHYSEIINKELGVTGKSVRQIIMGAVRYKLEMESTPLIEISAKKLNPEKIDKNAQSKLEELMYRYQELYLKTIAVFKNDGSIHVHPWYGVNNKNLQPYDINHVIEVLNLYQSDINRINSLLNTLKIQVETNGRADLPLSISKISELVFKLEQLIVLDDTFSSVSVAEFKYSNRLVELKNYIGNYQEIQGLLNILNKNISRPFLVDLIKDSAKISQNIFAIKKTPIKETVSLQDLSDKLNVMVEINDLFDKINSSIVNSTRPLGDRFNNLFSMSESGLKNLLIFIDHIYDLEPRLWKKRRDFFKLYEVDEIIQSLSHKIDLINNLKDKLTKIYNLSKLLDINELHKIFTDLSLSSWAGIFKKDWWKSRRKLKSISILRKDERTKK